MSIDLVRDVDKVTIYTMRDLNQDTAGTIRKINESGIPGVITRHNRFLAIIFPLAQPQTPDETGVDGRLIAAVINNMDPDEAAQIRGEKDADSVLSAAELSDLLGVKADVSAAENRELEYTGSSSGMPKLTDQQRTSNLQKSAAARHARTMLKDRLKSGGTSLVQVLKEAEGDDAVARMKVVELLAALPKIGRVKAEHIMMELEIAPTRRLRGLGERQRKALLERFDADQEPG